MIAGFVEQRRERAWLVESDAMLVKNGRVQRIPKMCDAIASLAPEKAVNSLDFVFDSSLI